MDAEKAETRAWNVYRFKRIYALEGHRSRYQRTDHPSDVRGLVSTLKCPSKL
jgi:hypothetical protein